MSLPFQDRHRWMIHKIQQCFSFKNGIIIYNNNHYYYYYYYYYYIKY